MKSPQLILSLFALIFLSSGLSFAAEKQAADDSSHAQIGHNTPTKEANADTKTAAVADEKKGGEAKKASTEEEEKDPEVVKLKKEVERLQLERDKLQAENSIAEAKLAKELAEQKAQLERDKLSMEAASQSKSDVDVISKLKAQLEMANLESQIVKAQTDQKVNEFRAKEEDLKAEVSRLNYEIQMKQKAEEREDYVDQEPVYLKDPLKDGTLILSDRRIALNDVITMGAADFVSERINYYNNKNKEFPIFIIIDDSPGGSVMAGYKILKAMEGSDAPVHVVVKSYAASMAAVITTMADKSYAYPNAILLQHQISSIFLGNLTQQREDFEETQEWWRRLAGPVTQKMGVELDEFIDMMYANKSTGDWNEFADKAQELKWVDIIVDEIQETGVVKNPDLESNSDSSTAQAPLDAERSGLKYDTDDKGRPVCILPRINSHDRWWLDNRDGYYR